MEKKTINEVREYFKNKLLAGDFEPTDIGVGDVLHLEVDGEYKFCIWVGPFASLTQTWHGSLMSIEFKGEEQEKLHKIVEPMFKALIKKNEAQKKRERFEQISKEYHELKKDFENE